eukprot:CAMPEP_0119322596 /NCGR_PEP_ID=MMETSP1333-20130426/58656_1 /TAXON_ID=418940 /ORGANISM="Scyphosphaera apsteinii, Strain RCC1455" /LENGTH=266 /DNA_ID=CAMNT_0007329863 /DNA_START=34 /DNA_END=835 /DNA_ORIENTATION=+
MANRGLLRLKKELKMIYEDPPPGISAWTSEDNASELEAVIQGAENTPYAKGSFRLHISVPPRYPFEPPKIHFKTPIYHPNIDSAGRICLDILNMPPKGAWKPSLNISTLLSSIQLLMSHPNPDDGLMLEITHEYIHNFAHFVRTATEHTRLHAMQQTQPITDVTAMSRVREASGVVEASGAGKSEEEASVMGGLGWQATQKFESENDSHGGGGTGRGNAAGDHSCSSATEVPACADLQSDSVSTEHETESAHLVWKCGADVLELLA